MGIDFANTEFVDKGQRVELLRSWSDVVSWLSEASLSTEARLDEASADGLTEVHKFRKEWRQELEKISHGTHISGSFVKRLNRALERDVFAELVVCPDGGNLQFERSQSKLKGEGLALAIIARQISKFLSDADLVRIHKCANPECVFYFYDSTKSKCRQWCSAELCGNRHKVAAFRNRQAKKRSSK